MEKKEWVRQMSGLRVEGTEGMPPACDTMYSTTNQPNSNNNRQLGEATWEAI